MANNSEADVPSFSGKQILQLLESNELPYYLIYSSTNFVEKLFLSKVKEKFEVQQWDEQTPSLFREIVIVSEFDLPRLSKWIKKPNKSTRLLMLFDSDFEVAEEQWAGALKEGYSPIELKDLTEKQYKELLDKRYKERFSVKIDPRVYQALLESDLDFEQICIKLDTVTLLKDHITPNDLKSKIDTNIFKLYEALIVGNTGSATLSLKKLLSTTDPLMLLKVLHTLNRKQLQAFSIVQRGHNATTIQETLGLRTEFEAELLKSRCRRDLFPKVIMLHSYLAEADHQIKVLFRDKTKILTNNLLQFLQESKKTAKVHS